jgi:hypothetical protein
MSSKGAALVNQNPKKIMHNGPTGALTLRPDSL